jgi:hypothetical protein
MLTFGVYGWQMLPYIAYMDPMGYIHIYNNKNSQLLNSEVFNLWAWLPPSKYRIYLLALLAGWNHTSKAT